MVLFHPFAGKGLINLTKNIALKSVLHVPKLACNLLSVSKLSRDSNCRVVFFESHCEFQEQNSGRMIGNAELCAGLYLFPPDESQQEKPYTKLCVSPESQFPSMSVSSSLSNKDSAIMLLHYRLGHPNFLYLKRLFPSLFINKNSKFFHCDICQFSKLVIGINLNIRIGIYLCSLA